MEGETGGRPCPQMHRKMVLRRKKSLVDVSLQSRPVHVRTTDLEDTRV